MYALVKYKIDNITKCVPVSFIKGFKRDTFLEGAQYKVFWSPKEGQTPTHVLGTQGYILEPEKLKEKKGALAQQALAGWYEALVLKIGDNKEDLKEQIAKKRVPMPSSKGADLIDKKMKKPKGDEGKVSKPPAETGSKRKTSSSNSKEIVADQCIEADGTSSTEENEKDSDSASKNKMSAAKKKRVKKEASLANTDRLESKFSAKLSSEDDELVLKSEYEAKINHLEKLLKDSYKKLSQKCELLQESEKERLESSEALKTARKKGADLEKKVADLEKKVADLEKELEVQRSLNKLLVQGKLNLSPPKSVVTPVTPEQLPSLSENVISPEHSPDKVSEVKKQLVFEEQKKEESVLEDEPDSCDSETEHPFALSPETIDLCKARIKRGQQGDSNFVKNTAMALWGSNKLATSSVTGVKCNSKKGSIAKPKLTPVKVKYIGELLKKRILGEVPKPSRADRLARQKNVTKYLSSKISTLNLNSK